MPVLFSLNASRGTVEITIIGAGLTVVRARVRRCLKLILILGIQTLTALKASGAYLSFIFVNGPEHVWKNYSNGRDYIASSAAPWVETADIWDSVDGNIGDDASWHDPYLVMQSTYIIFSIAK